MEEPAARLSQSSKTTGAGEYSKSIMPSFIWPWGGGGNGKSLLSNGECDGARGECEAVMGEWDDESGDGLCCEVGNACDGTIIWFRNGEVPYGL